MTMPRVYVVQRPMRSIRNKDGDIIDRVPMFDLSPAREFGTVHVLLEHGAIALMPSRLTRKLRGALKEFGPDDYLIPTGDPVAAGVAVAMAAAKNCGRIKLLRWDKQDGAYTPLDYNLYGVQS